LQTQIAFAALSSNCFLRVCYEFQFMRLPLSEGATANIDPLNFGLGEFLPWIVQPKIFLGWHRQPISAGSLGGEGGPESGAIYLVN